MGMLSCACLSDNGLRMCLGVCFAEGDRKAYYETSQWTIKQNRETILAAKAENKELRGQMATMRIDLSKRGQKVRPRSAPLPPPAPRPQVPYLQRGAAPALVHLDALLLAPPPQPLLARASPLPPQPSRLLSTAWGLQRERGMSR